MFKMLLLVQYYYTVTKYALALVIIDSLFANALHEINTICGTDWNIFLHRIGFGGFSLHLLILQ